MAYQGYGPPGYPQQQPGQPQPGYNPQQHPGQPNPYGQQYQHGPPPGGMPGQPPQFGAGPPSGIDPTLYSWFTAVDHDRSGRITAIELQQALVNNNWSHFNPETCRMMIAMFDKDRSGTIDINEFAALWQYIQQWKSTFDGYDRDRSGTIEVNELSLAFNTMGYRLSPQFAALVITKFDAFGKRQLRFDNFIQACVMLKSLTDSFRMLDTNQNGVVNVNYEQFLEIAVHNKG